VRQMRPEPMKRALETSPDIARLLQVKPIERESSEANAFRACPLQDLDELQRVMEAADAEAAARRRLEEEAAARRAKEEKDAEERKKRDERAQEKIREAAKKPLPSFKDLKKNKAAVPARVSASDDSGASKDAGVLNRVPTAASEARPLPPASLTHTTRVTHEGDGAGSTRRSGDTLPQQRSVVFSPNVEQRVIAMEEEDDSKSLTPNTKSLQQYANAQHIGDILLQWGIMSKDQVRKGSGYREVRHQAHKGLGSRVQGMGLRVEGTVIRRARNVSCTPHGP